MSKQIDRARELADKVEMFSYMKQFTAGELQELKEDLTQTSIELKANQQELKEISKEMKAKIKPLKEAVALTVSFLKDKARSVTEKCFVEFDHEKGMANYYSESTGDMVYTRPLQASEMQKTIRLKTGTND